MIYYDKPTQVKFYDPENDDYRAGIAFCGEIICLCCGAFFSIDEFVLDIQENYPMVEPIIELPWISLNEECLGT
jgi:hypothetical protein